MNNFTGACMIQGLAVVLVHLPAIRGSYVHHVNSNTTDSVIDDFFRGRYQLGSESGRLEQKTSDTEDSNRMVYTKSLHIVQQVATCQFKG